MASYPPAVSDFKTYFAREFIYGSGLDSVQDSDITRALNEAQDGSVFPVSVWDSTAQQITANLYLAAHLLWENIDSAGGLSALPRGRGLRGDSEGITTSKSVGAVSVNYEKAPDWVTRSPAFSRFWRSKGGARYAQMLYLRTIGNFAVVAGYNDISVQPDPNNPI